MSAALDFSQFPEPLAFVPGPRRPRLVPVAPDGLVPARHPGQPHRSEPGVSAGGATVVRLAPPSASSVAAPLRLTRRGVRAVALSLAVAAAALVVIAWASAPRAGGSNGSAAAVTGTVTVQPGDTLWSIADRVAPSRDPRAEVATLQRLNRLPGVDLVAGQVLRLG